MILAFEELRRRLREEASVDVDAAFTDFRTRTGDDDIDAFLVHLRQRGAIDDLLFTELLGGQEIAVARLIAVRADRTLALEPPRRRTLIVGAAASAERPTVIAGGTSPGPARPPLAALPAPPAGSSRYSMLGCLGKGAMGEVHIARDEDLLRKVAFKRMVPEVAASRDLAERFFSEIQVTAQLDHPNIVPIYGLEVGDDQALGYSMKLVQGRTLAALVEEARRAGAAGEPARLAARLEVFLKVCDAIAYAHSKGVLHRDLKPENIMVGRYHEVYVMDWGICRLMGSDDPGADELAGVRRSSGVVATVRGAHERTQFGAVLGTPAYMSPEQAAGKNPELDGRSDQYALGLILHELCALRAAVHGDSLEAVLARARAGYRDPLVHALPGVRIPRELHAIVARATAPRREDRYPSVGELADDLRRFLRGQAVRAAPDNPLQRAARFLGRHRAGTLAALLALVVLGAGATIGVMWRGERAVDAARRHEERLQALWSAVSERSHDIDNHFYRFEALLAGLAGSATEALARRGALDVPVLHSDDIVGRVDFVDSRYYGRPMSVEQVTIKLAPGLARDATVDDARLVSSLRAAMSRAVLGSDTAVNASSAGQRLLTEGLPVHRAFVSLESGVHATFPGDGAFPAAYDGRKRPKYLLAKGRAGTFWGNPYPDRAGRGLLLPMSASLWSPDGTFLGVAGVDTTFDYIAGSLLGLAELPAVTDSYLVDGEGRVVVHWSARDGAAPAPQGSADLHDDRPIDLAPLPFPEVLPRLREHGAGILETGGKLLLYEPLASLDWSYVVVADAARAVR